MMNGIQFMIHQMAARKAQPRSRDQIRARVAELRLTMSQRETARELGISRSTVFNLLREHERQSKGKS